MSTIYPNSPSFRDTFPVAFVVLACLACLSVKSADAEKVVKCPRLIGNLKLDGSMADPVFRSQVPLTGFLEGNSGERAAAQTEIRVCYDDTRFFLLATCREPNVKGIRASVKRRDEDVRGDDFVELIFRTGNRRPIHLMASASGALYDALLDAQGKPDVTWNSGTKTAVQVFKKAWGIELSIPLSDLSLSAERGERLSFNVRRSRGPGHDISVLRPWPGRFPRKEDEFMTLEFGEAPLWLRPVAPVRPRAGIRYSADDIENARRNVQLFDWARGLASLAVNNADRYLKKSADFDLSFLPPRGATFAYGFAGCPHCHARWPRFGSSLCSFDKPGKVTCRQCKTVFPSDDPNDPYFDPGDGVVVQGDRYYFKGIWHAWVINEYKKMIAHLAYAYALTGHEPYAERAALLFDAMATLAPSTVGPRDNMRPNQKVAGRFHYYTQQWTEFLRSYLLYYDLLYHSPAMARISPTNPTGFGKEKKWTIRQNIEKNLFLDTWDVEMNTRNGRLPNLHNHTSATVRAMLGVGLVCGEPDLIRWGIEAAYKFLYNTVDPEGQYYETSGAGYNECGRQCNASFADLLYKYDPKNYEDSARFPQPGDYPYQIKLYHDSRMKLHLDQVLYEMDCVGHRPRYGDGGGDVAVITSPAGEWSRIRFKWAFALYRSAVIPGEKRLYYRKMLAASGGELARQFRNDWDALFLFHPLDDPPKMNPGEDFNIRRSSLWGFKATAILRSGKGADRMALLLRGGSIMPHGNDDTLHISLYSQGQMLTHEIGYDLYGRPIHLGWATRSIAHCTVTVDERGAPPFYRVGPNADVRAFADTPTLKFVAMSAGKRHWKTQPQIKEYARAAAVVALPDGGGYFFDRFDVAGGHQHDYSFHGQVTEHGEGFSIENASFQHIPKVWTLAGLSGHAEDSFDAPGRSWGERVLPGNRIRKLDIPGEKVGYFGWYPPPANGYGFIYDVRAGTAEKNIVADWTTQKEQDIHLRMHLFSGDGTTFISGKGPDLTGTKVIPFVISRRKGENLESTFLAVMEGYTAKPRIRKVTGARALDGMKGLAITVEGGITDRVWADTGGRAAFARTRDGEVAELSLVNFPEVSCQGLSLKLLKPVLRGKIISVDYQSHRFTTDLNLDNPSALAGTTLFVSSADYKQNSAYRIETCDASGRFAFGPVGFGLARADYGRRLKDGRIETTIPGPLVRSAGPTGALDGKVCVTDDGESRGLIASFDRFTTYRLKPGSSLTKGDSFIIYDVKRGDEVTLPMAATLRRLSKNEWELQATGDIVLDLGSAALSYVKKGEMPKLQQGPARGFHIPVSISANGPIRLRTE